MESTPEQAAEEYRLTLAELRTNNKTQINLLTILADDYRQFSENIVDTIEAHLQTVPPSQKLTVLYVCDSIMKNVKKPNDYDVLFSRKIVSMFEHAFRQGDERVRAALYKLRVTWGSTQVFIPSRLYQLDMKINQLDTAWPISNPRTGKSLRNDPQVAPPENATSSSSAAAPRGTASPRIFVNPRFIEGKPATSSAPAPPKKTEKTKPMVKAEPKEHREPKEHKPVKKEPKIDPLDKLLPTASSASSHSTTAPKSSPSAPKRKATPTEHTAAPSRKSTKSLDEDLRQMNVKKANQKDQDFRAPPRSLKPTSVVGSHAFAAPVRAPSPFVGGAAGWTVPPSQHYNSPPQDPAPPIRAQQPPVATPAAPPPAPVKNVYASEQTKLDVPANNRIFVDGKAYEVMFVDDTAVIERAGAPHRIYFAGPPRNLIIDGVPHLVPFDTPTPVDILGAQHTVKFGAPSRELYIGGHPFKGQFGGPPIVATINGRRHEIRLTGSAPEVKIEPEPAYHLTRFLHKMREEKKIETTAENKQDWLSYLKNLQKSGILPPVKSSTPPPPQQNPHAKRRGGRPPPPPPPQGQWSQQPTMMEPVPLSSGVEKRGAPPANLSEFNIRLLQIRYDSVVESLIKKRDDACRFCGMRIGDQRSEFAMAHLDMHVRQNLTNQASQTTTYRLWYPLETDWLTDRASDQPSDKKDAVEGAPLPGVASSGVKAKECAVCQETFDEYYDDDEETWRLRDTVSVHGKIVHAACSEDAVLETPNSSMTKNPFFVEIKEEEVDEEDVKDFKHTVNFGQPLSSA